AIIEWHALAYFACGLSNMPAQSRQSPQDMHILFGTDGGPRSGQLQSSANRQPHQANANHGTRAGLLIEGIAPQAGGIALRALEAFNQDCERRFWRNPLPLRDP